jgi:hypothetical protein
MVLGHDVTEIVPGRFKGPVFKRGHVIRQEDVSRLRDLGKENIATLDLGFKYEIPVPAELPKAVWINPPSTEYCAL